MNGSDRIGSTYESEVNSRNRNKYFFSRNRKPESEPQTFLTGIEPGIGSLFFQQSESESVPESEVTELHICHPYFLWTSRIAHIMGSYQLCLQGRGKIELLPLSLPTCTIYPGRQISGVHRRGGANTNKFQRITVLDNGGDRVPRMCRVIQKRRLGFSQIVSRSQKVMVMSCVIGMST